MSFSRLKRRVKSCLNTSKLGRVVSAVDRVRLQRSVSDMNFNQAQKIVAQPPPVKPAIPASLLLDSEGQERSHLAQKIRSIPYKIRQTSFEGQLEHYNRARKLLQQDELDNNVFIAGRPVDEWHYKPESAMGEPSSTPSTARRKSHA